MRCSSRSTVRTMSIDYNVLPLGKGKTCKQLKARKDREDAKQLKAFRDGVWKREGQKEWPGFIAGTYGRCQHCHAYVTRAREYELSGEVHHRISRRHKATRYDPDNGVLLCNFLVNGCHE